jgi:hydroxypyruvate isomerase
MLIFSANVSLAFREYPFLERFQRAADLGFKAVEFGVPPGHDVHEIVRAVEDAGLHVSMFSFATGDLAGGERGFASHPDKVDWWRNELRAALDLAVRLDAGVLNALAGCVVPGLGREVQIDCLVANLKWAIPHLREAGVPAMLEALNPYEHRGYLLIRSAEVLSVLDRVASPWCKFQFDAYHLQRVEGDLVRTLRAHIDQIGYVHIADNPGRHEPGTGEINYPFFLQALEDTGYDDYVGLEYLPSGRTEDSFGWLPRDQRGGPTTTADLNL